VSLHLESPGINRSWKKLGRFPAASAGYLLRAHLWGVLSHHLVMEYTEPSVLIQILLPGVALLALSALMGMRAKFSACFDNPVVSPGGLDAPFPSLVLASSEG